MSYLGLVTAFWPDLLEMCAYHLYLPQCLHVQMYSQHESVSLADYLTRQVLVFVCGVWDKGPNLDGYNWKGTVYHTYAHHEQAENMRPIARLIRSS